jgi:hypothetical protein
MCCTQEDKHRFDRKGFAAVRNLLDEEAKIEIKTFFRGFLDIARRYIDINIDSKNEL